MKFYGVRLLFIGYVISILALCGGLRWGKGCVIGLQSRSSSSISATLSVEKTVAAGAIASTILISTTVTSLPSVARAKDPLPTLDRIFTAVRKEIGPDGESIARLKDDINNENWEDILTYTREYDAGFRGGVMKAAWKQLGTRAHKRLFNCLRIIFMLTRGLEPS